MGLFGNFSSGGIGNKGPSQSTTTNNNQQYEYNNEWNDESDRSTKLISQEGDAVLGNKVSTQVDSSVNVDARSVTDSRNQSTTYVDSSTHLTTDQGLVSATGRVLEEMIRTGGRQLEAGFTAQADTLGYLGKAMSDANGYNADVAGMSIMGANSIADRAIRGAGDSQGSALAFASNIVDRLSAFASRSVDAIQQTSAKLAATADSSISNSAGVAIDATRGLAAVKGDANARIGSFSPVMIAAAVVAGLVAIFFIWKK